MMMKMMRLKVNKLMKTATHGVPEKENMKTRMTPTPKLNKQSNIINTPCTSCTYFKKAKKANIKIYIDLIFYLTKIS